MKRPSVRLVICALTIAVLAVSVPGSLRLAREHGGFYLFSVRFFEDIPKRLAGPGRLRFIFQPVMAIFLGWGAGRADARDAGRSFLHGLFRRPGERAAHMKEAVDDVAVLLLMGILLDSVFQWVLLGASYPGAALVVGPVLITVPYAAARGFAGALPGRTPPPASDRHDPGGSRS